MIDKKHCLGCHNNYYNGNNPYGIKECWSIKKAELVERIAVGMQEPPPYKNKKLVKVPNCWQGEGPNRILYIKPEALDSNGYWRH